MCSYICAIYAVPIPLREKVKSELTKPGGDISSRLAYPMVLGNGGGPEKMGLFAFKADKPECDERNKPNTKS